MSDKFEPVDRPAPNPECTPQQILTGPPISPEDRIKLYSDAQFEDFIREWAFFFLQEKSGKYVRVERFGGAGDMGRDIVGYADDSAVPPVCDVFQCKHYAHPLMPSEIWPELAKLCYFTFKERLPVPRRYRIVAPQDVGPDLGRLLEDPDKLKEGLVKEWLDNKKSTPLSKRITSKQTILLDGKLEKHVTDFHFSAVAHKPILEVISEHRQTIRYAPRFGGGLTRPLPPDQEPPEAIAASEARYVAQLLAAYQDHTDNESLDLAKLGSNSELAPLHEHFNRSRERYYSAETLREFSKDNLPEQFSFEQVQEQVLDGVIDTAEGDYDSGYERVRQTTNAAGQVRISEHPLQGQVKGRSLRGICHQLANDDRLVWVKRNGSHNS